MEGEVASWLLGGMDAPDQLTKVKVCPQYNFLIFCPPPPRGFLISVAHFASPGVRLDAPVLIQQQLLLQLLVCYYVFIFPAYLKHGNIVPTLRVSGLHTLCSNRKLTFLFFAGVTHWRVYIGDYTIEVVWGRFDFKVDFFKKN